MTILRPIADDVIDTLWWVRSNGSIGYWAHVDEDPASTDSLNLIFDNLGGGGGGNLTAFKLLDGIAAGISSVTVRLNGESFAGSLYPSSIFLREGPVSGGADIFSKSISPFAFNGTHTFTLDPVGGVPVDITNPHLVLGWAFGNPSSGLLRAVEVEIDGSIGGNARAGFFTAMCLFP